MEVLLPALALGGLYTISQQEKANAIGRGGAAPIENFQQKGRLRAELLPNTDIPNRNFPDEYPIQNREADLTSKLSTTNIFDAPQVYTDKYFDIGRANKIIAQQQAQSGFTPPTYRSMTGEQVDMDYFRHNNMAPFFGSKSHANNHPNATESTLDAYTGAGSNQFRKKEQSPLFSPSENYQWPTGMPNTTDFIQSRMNPSMNMANYKPFEEIKVAPGLGLGYSADGAAGFNSGMLAREMWMDKTVDELRAVNNPKASGLGLYGYEGAPMSQNPVYGQIGQVEKKLPPKTFDNDSSRWFTTTGIEKAPPMDPNIMLRNVVRQHEEYTGGAANATLQGVRGEYMEPHTQQLPSLPFTAAYSSGMGNAKEEDYGYKSNQVFMNNRTLGRNGPNGDDSYYGTIKNTIGAAVAPFLDTLRPSRKENTVGNIRPYQNAKSSVEQSYMFNPNDRAPTTIRETTENSKMHMVVDANQHGGAYMVTTHDDLRNQRDTTTDFYYAGIAEAGAQNQRPRTYDAEYNQRNNDIKSSTIDGRLVPGNMDLFNNHVNMTQRPQERLLKNERPVTGTFYQTPSIEGVGMLQGSTNLELYQGQQLDRNNGDVLSQLKQNPYVLSHLNGI
jgi:hypothetical protein